MKKTSLHTSLLLTTALLLVACDQQKNNQSEETSSNNDDAISFYTSYVNDTPAPTVSGSYLAGQFAQSHSDWANASNYFARVLDVEPDAEDIQRRVMALDMGSGHYDKAIANAKSILKENKGDVTLAHLLSALSSFKASKYDDALKEIEGHQDNGLGVAVLPLLRAWAAAGQGKTDINDLKDSPSLLYQSVLIAAYTKDNVAIANLAKTYDFTKTPTPIARLEDIADIFTTFGEKEEARSIYRALQIGLPDRAAFYSSKLATLDSESSIPAIKEFDTPQMALSDALYDMARLLSNGYEDSSRLFSHMALYLNAKNSSALELLAQISSQNGLYSEAISYLSRIDTQNDIPQKIKITRQMAQLTADAGQINEAIRILNHAVDENKSVDAQIQIGDLYRNNENYKDALKAYDKAFDMLDNKITPQYWDLSFARGMVNERLKNWEQAEKDLQTALLYEPDQPYVLNYLGYSWADQGTNLEKAAEMVEKAVRLKPDDGAIVDSLGWVYFRMGNFDKSVKTLEQAIELSPTEAEINDHLGDAYWRVGRKSEARFQWKRAASFSKDEKSTTDILTKIENGLPPLPPRTATEKIVKNQ